MENLVSTRHYWPTLGILLLVGVLCIRELSLLPDGNLHAHFFSVGQADSILLVSPSGKQVLVDGGRDLQPLESLGKYMPFFDRTIELLVLTHPNADHLTSFPEILKRYNVKAMLLSGVDFPVGRYQAILDELQRQNISVIFADPEQDIDLGDGVVMDIVWPLPEVFGTKVTEVNNTSVVSRVRFGSASLLLTGDIEEVAEQELLATGADLRSGAMQAPHHGSRSSSSTGIILAASPGLAVISVPVDSPYGHPHPEILDRYKHFGIPLFTTATGTVSLTLQKDGKIVTR